MNGRQKNMKIKDLDKKTIDYYCDEHWCNRCPLYDFSNKLSINCFDIPNFIGHLKQIDSLTEISILTKEEWLYLRATIKFFKGVVETIRITNDCIWIKFRSNYSCEIKKRFKFEGLIKDKDYTLQELDL